LGRLAEAMIERGWSFHSFSGLPKLLAKNN